MDNRKQENPSKESGQTLVLVALLLVGLVAMLGLVLDGGGIYLERRRMQNAADAGAIAGAVVLAQNGGDALALSRATEYAVARNQAAVCQVTIEGQSIAVVAKVGYSTTFARIVGVELVTVTARAEVRYAPVGALAGLAPVSVLDFPYVMRTKSYTIWDDNPDTSPDPTSGNISGSYRGWLGLNCVYPVSCGDAGAYDLKEWMTSGYEGTTGVDTWIRGSGGVKASTIAQAYVGQILKMVVFDAIEDKYSSNAYYHVIKFAAFKVTKVYATGNPKGIQGTFEYFYAPGAATGTQDGGVRTITLTR